MDATKHGKRIIHSAEKIGILALSFLLIMQVSAQNSSITLPTHFKFIMRDDEAFSKTDFDDAGWKEVSVPMSWDKLGLNKEKSVGWYRAKIELPAALLNQDLIIYLGTIDDADETWLNGKLIGSTGKFPPADASAWDIERKYLVKKEWLQKNNSLAIRVYNGIGDGGFMAGRVFIQTKKESDRQIAAQIKSKKSYYQLTTSNGLIAAVYNEQTDVVENVYPHIFSYYDSGLAVRPFVQNIKLKNPPPVLNAFYEQNTHVIKVQYAHFSIEYFASFIHPEKIFYAVAKGDPQYLKNVSFISEHTSGGLISNETEGINIGNKKYFLFSFKDSLEDNNLAVTTAITNILRTRPDMPLQEVQYMQKLFAQCKIPAAITSEERNTLQQSIAVLKMSQVSDKEIFPLSRGQVLASLRPGVWAISWVRDASFAIEAMSKLGMHTEAKKALEFMLNSRPTNQYIHYVFSDGKDYGIGLPYIISVTRYFGNGREESDFNSEGPNIEIDDFGLFLTAFYHYVHESGDGNFLRKWSPQVDTICKAIIHNINEKNIIRTESGPWEHHLPGKEFMWTSGVCARGLQLTSMLQKQYGLPYQRTQEAHQRLYKGIIDNALINRAYIKGNATEINASDHHYFDAATFELFANGLITDKKLFATHMQEYNKHNRAANDANRGYIRFNSGDSYENQEWPFAGLRVAVAQKNAGNKTEAKKLVDRITGFANRNNNQVPEILSNDMNMYRGAIPMVGYGAGAYILSLLNYYNN